MQFPHQFSVAEGLLTGTLWAEPNNQIRAEIYDQGTETKVFVTLESETEAEKLLAELDDPDGDMMHADGAICGKYAELHCLRP